MPERIQKIISASGLMSRRRAEQYITDGKVTVNGAVAGLGDKADPETDEICVDGVKLDSAPKAVYVMVNKPKGYVSTAHDEQGRKCVTELAADVGTRLYPVGRLDMYSEGLIILTNDGDFANKLMHPSHNVSKTYRTWVSGEDIGYAVEIMRGPLDIDGYIISPAEVDIVMVKGRNAVLDITIHEGRNRQVRKMCEQTGLHVDKLCRISEGGIELGDLKSGQWRYLTAEEVADLKNRQ